MSYEVFRFDQKSIEGTARGLTGQSTWTIGHFYGLEVLGISLPSPCLTRTSIFLIYHWYSSYLHPSHLFTFTASYSPPTSYENLWALFGDHGDQRTEHVSSARTFSYYLLCFICRPGLFILYCTFPVGGPLTSERVLIEHVVKTFCKTLFRSNWRYGAKLSLLQVVIIHHMHQGKWLTDNDKLKKISL